MTTPNVEERLAAAAFTILTDDQRHAHQARVWARRYIVKAAHGSRTEFQSIHAPLSFPRMRGNRAGRAQ